MLCHLHNKTVKISLKIERNYYKRFGYKYLPTLDKYLIIPIAKHQLKVVFKNGTKEVSCHFSIRTHIPVEKNETDNAMAP